MRRTGSPSCRDECGIITWGWSTSIRSNRDALHLVGLGFHKKTRLIRISCNTVCRFSIYQYSREMKYQVFSKKQHNLLFLLTKVKPCKLPGMVKTLLASLPKHLQTCVFKHIYNDKFCKSIKEKYLCFCTVLLNGIK